MAVHSFAKELENTNPKIRGLALRGLCALRFEGFVNFTAPHVIKALDDEDPYVRKTAVNSVLKLFYIERSFVEENDLLTKLYQLLKDSSQMVVLSSINVLHEIMHDEGGMGVNYSIVVYLLNRVKDFDEFGQAIILDLTSRLEVESDTEMYTIMNNIVDLLKSSSPSVVLATVRIYLKYIEYEIELLEPVMERIKTPLITLLYQGERESRFVVIHHIRNIINRGAAKYFQANYKEFYCQADDPHYIQELKLDILTKLATEENLNEILNELGEYANDIDTYLSKKAVSSLGELGAIFPKRNNSIIKQFESFIVLKKSHLLEEISSGFREMLIKTPNKVPQVAPFIEELLENVKEEDSKVSNFN